MGKVKFSLCSVWSDVRVWRHLFLKSALSEGMVSFRPQPVKRRGKRPWYSPSKGSLGTEPVRTLRKRVDFLSVSGWMDKIIFFNLCRNGHSSVSIVTKVWDGRPRNVSVPCLSKTPFRSQSGRDHWPASCVKLKNTWRCSSTSSRVVVTWCLNNIRKQRRKGMDFPRTGFWAHLPLAVFPQHLVINPHV